ADEAVVVAREVLGGDAVAGVAVQPLDRGVGRRLGAGGECRQDEQHGGEQQQGRAHRQVSAMIAAGGARAVVPCQTADFLLFWGFYRDLGAGRSFNGRTADSDSAYRGSNPCLPANYPVLRIRCTRRAAPSPAWPRSEPVTRRPVG